MLGLLGKNIDSFLHMILLTIWGTGRIKHIFEGSWKHEPNDLFAERKRKSNDSQPEPWRKPTAVNQDKSYLE